MLSSTSRPLHLLTSSRLLSGTKITSLATLSEAIETLHKTHRTPHIIVTSVRFEDTSSTLSVVGSTRRSDYAPRIFKVDVPSIECFFSGTGDMFAALTVVRFRQAITDANLNTIASWMSPDDIEPIDLPLAKATEKVLASMHTVLEKTKKHRDEVLERMSEPLVVKEEEKESEKSMHLRRTKAAEIRIVRNLQDLREPNVVYRAEAL